MPVPLSNTGRQVRFLFTADCYGQPLRIQYVDGALWFVQADLNAILKIPHDESIEARDSAGSWRIETIDGVEETLIDERVLEGLLECGRVQRERRFSV